MLFRAGVLALIMCVASVSPMALHREDRNVAGPAAIDLESLIPRSFGSWRERALVVQVVNPQTKAMLDKLYSQLLTRIYADDSGNTIMLTIAYGSDQRGNLEVHKPEVCYPAQGFSVHRNVASSMETPFGPLAVRQLETSLGPRKEPLTYWSTMGSEVIEGRIQKRIAELSAVLAGRTPDGLLVRVSSIDPDAAHGWQVQQQFVRGLLQALSSSDRQRLAGFSQP